MSEVMTSRIGRFEILDSLGDSVAGNHYRAFDPATNRNVAVETFRTGTLPGDAARDTFVQGLKRSAQLLHPRIASVFDVGVDNDVAYVASEDLSGTTLDQSMLEYGPFELGDIAPVIRQIGAALDYAHAQGIVHGGLEPGRVLVLDSGDVKLTGFGTRFPEVKTSHGAHTFIGDPRYFSPERVRGEELTHRADIFSFGAIVYELLTGQAPFDSDSLITSLYRVVNEPHRPATELRPGLPAGVDEILDYALAKQPKDRYLSCATLVDSLEALIPEAAPEAPSVEAAAAGQAEAIQYCDQCGLELQAKMKFCWSCGATVTHEAEAPVVASDVPVSARISPDVAPVGAEVVSTESVPSAGKNVVKIEAVPVPKAPPVERSPATVRQSQPLPEVMAAQKPPEIPEMPELPAKPEPSPVVDVAAVAPPALAGSATTSKSSAVKSRATVPMEAVASGLADVGQPLEVKAPARTEAAPARTEVAPVRTEVAPARTEAAPTLGSVPPPLSGYAKSTGTKDLPAPGAAIDAAPAKVGKLRAMLPIIIFLMILAAFMALGFFFAPRFLAPKQQAPPPAAESSAPVESQQPAQAVPSEAAPTDAPPAP